MKHFLRLLLAQWPLWAVVFGPTLIVYSVFATVVIWTAYNDDYEPDCQSQVTSLIKSPELSHRPRHVALVRDESCVVTGIGGSSWQVQCVHLLGERTRPLHKNEVFCIHDYVPGPRLEVRWLSPRRLQITAPNTAIVAKHDTRYGPIRVELRFDPDDPTARKSWLQSQGRADL